jgi:hypothetical protein
LLTRKDLSKARIDDTHLERRITDLVERERGRRARPYDDWWSVGRCTNVGKVADHVAELAEEVGVPFLERLLAPSGLIEFLESRRSAGLTRYDEERLLTKLKLLAQLMGGWTARRSHDEVTLNFHRDGTLTQEVTSGDKHEARRNRFLLDGSVIVVFRESSSKLMRFETLERMRLQSVEGADLLLDYQGATTRFSRAAQEGLDT